MLGCGGLIQQAVGRGAEVHVALMTNGDASELSLVFGEGELPLRPEAFADLGRARQQESIKALGSLGLEADHIHFLGYPNNGIVALWRPDHWLRSSPYRSPFTRATSSPYERAQTPGAVYAGEQVLSDVVALLQEVKPDAVFVTHPQDIHPDHWSTCAFVSYALAALTASDADSWARRTRLYGYLIHWPRFPSPRRLRPKLPLSPPRDILAPRLAWLELPLSPDETKAKLAATRMYRSQLPSLDRLLLDFARANELFVLLPVRTVRVPDSIVWIDGEDRRRNLRGAEVNELTLSLARDSQSRAALVRSPRKLGKGAYVSVDFRSWDTEGAPIIENVTIARGARPKGVLIENDEAHSFSVQVRDLGSGRLTIDGLTMPGTADHEAFRGGVVTCWGSVRDKVTDPAVVARIASRPAVHN